MTTVRQLLRHKGHDIWSIPPTASMYEALEKLDEKRVGALLVMEDARLVGILSERDYARKVILRGKSSRETPVREVMTADVITVTQEQSIRECMAIMTDRRIRHLPVLEGEHVIGVISIGDVVRHIIAEQEFAIEQLESYIATASA